MRLSDFGREVRKLRIDRDERLLDMAERLDVSVAFLSAVETGRRPAPDSLVENLIAAYELCDRDASQLWRYAAKMRSEFPIKVPAGASDDQRAAAAVLARRFPTLSSEKINRIMKLVDD